MNRLKAGISRNRLRALVAGGSACALLIAGMGVAAAADRSLGALVVSKSADRSNPVSLSGYTASGNVYVFLNRDNAVEASFYVDDRMRASQPYSVERLPAYDLAKTAVDGTANAFDTKSVADGSHNITAVVKTRSGATRVFSSTFRVQNSVVTTTSTTSAPTTTVKPTTTVSPTTISPTTTAPTTSTTVKPTTTTAAPTTTTTAKPTTTTTATPTTTTPAAAGWPGSSNTGYKNAPGYTGSLTNFSGTIQSNTTYRFMNFPNGLNIGSSSVHPTNVTFYGCRFASNSLADANVGNYGDNITFDYSTFEPSAQSSAPVAYNKGYQYGIDVRYGGQMTVDHSDFWGFGNGIQFWFSTQAKPFVVKNSWFHDARSDGGIDHTDAILSNDGGPTYVVIDHNTISSVGNTNGLALQYDNTDYSNITVSNNYFSGFGYTANFGGSGHIKNSSFTGNVFANNFKPVYGPLYGWGGAGSNVLWRNNKFVNVSGGYGPFPASGTYWWPTDNWDGPTQLVGHNTDYTG